MLQKLLRPLLAGAGAAGALAMVNRGLRDALPLNPLPGTQRRWTWRGYEIFAAEAGTGPLVLLVHGIYAGASSYEYRRLFPLLARTHRVVAIDLLGCGLSDKPDLEYSTELFVEQIVDALGEFGDGPTTLIGSSLGGAFAIRAATRAADRVKRLVAICPTGLEGELDGPVTTAGRALTAGFRAPLVGEALFNALASTVSIRTYLERRVYGERANVTPDVVAQYYAIAHQPGARYVAAQFIGGSLNCDVARDLPFVEAPMLVLWGKRARTNPARNAAEFAALAQNAEVSYLVHSGLLPHDEEAAEVAERIERFIAQPPDGLSHSS